MSITNLGYDDEAPLPTMLTLSEIYGETSDLKSTKEEQSTLSEHMAVLAEFVNKDKGIDKTGKRPFINEEIFVKSWLPHFYNENDNINGVLVTSAWIEAVAHSSYHAVDVYRGNELIYRIPPVSGKLAIVHSDSKRKSVSALYKDMENTLKRVPHAKEQQLNYMLSRINEPKSGHKTDISHEINLRLIYVLDEIFTYYGYKTILTPELMSYKEKVMGVKENGSKSIGSVSVESNEFDDDDSYLFG